MVFRFMNALAAFIQSEWIGYEQADNMDKLADIFGNSSAILDSQLIGEYFNSQSTLLCAVLFLAFIACVTCVVFLLFVFARFCFEGCGAERYQKHPTSVKWFVVTLAAFLVLWVLMGVCVLAMVLSTSAVSSRTLEPEDRIPIDHTFNGSETDRHVVIKLDSVFIDESVPEALDLDEVQQLQRFKDVRELGYEFKPLEADSTYLFHEMMFWLIAALYSFLALVAGFVVLLGTWQYLISYHPMDRSVLSNYCGQFAVFASVALFAAVPLALAFGATFLVYAHAHEMMCPLVQTLTQNANMEDYINAHFVDFDPNNIAAFLNDLLVERMELNQQTCHAFVAPIEGVWVAAVLCGLLSLPLVFLLLRLSKYFLKMDTKYYWNHHENYSTIPEREKGKPQPVFHPKF